MGCQWLDLGTGLLCKMLSSNHLEWTPTREAQPRSRLHSPRRRPARVSSPWPDRGVTFRSDHTTSVPPAFSPPPAEHGRGLVFQGLGPARLGSHCAWHGLCAECSLPGSMASMAADLPLEPETVQASRQDASAAPFPGRRRFCVPADARTSAASWPAGFSASSGSPATERPAPFQVRPPAKRTTPGAFQAPGFVGSGSDLTVGGLVLGRRFGKDPVQAARFAPR